VNDPAPTTQAIEAVLRAVLDPEIGESIVDLGLVASVEFGQAQVRVALVPTSATCPMSEVLLQEVKSAVSAVCPANWEVFAHIDFGRKWDPSRMSPALQQRFGWVPRQD